MSIEAQINSLSVSAVDAIEVMQSLDLSTHEINDPVRFNQFKDVLDYVGKLPDKRFFINKAIAGKNVDKLKHLWEYCEINKRKDAKRKELAQLDEEIALYEK